jgi:phosphatidylserine/phosphatidylglycerophosphate/cardiolipin synthase-like enzyme
MMKKLILITCLLITVAGCAKKLTVSLPGAELPPGGVNKTLPELKTSKPKSFSSALENSLKQNLENKFVSVQELKLLQNGDTWYPMLALINHAEHFLYLNFLSITCDEKTEEMIRAIESKARSNEKGKTDVRLIVNKGFSALSKSCLKRLENAGVKILKAKTHASYILNDKKEIMIGSQSIARMFFNSDGFNSLDRDMMLYARGLIVSQAVHDFASTWLEEKTEDLDLIKTFSETLSWNQEKNQDKTQSRCVLASQRPKDGVTDIEKALLLSTKENSDELYFSGVKVDTGNHEMGRLLQEKSLKGMQVHYIGNGYLSGNGELTMVLNEWVHDLKLSKLSFIAPAVEGIKLWDMRRNALENKKTYDRLIGDSKINVWTYFNFIHHKVWLFDGPAFFIGSANFDSEKFANVSDAGLFCVDQSIHDQLKKELLRDKQNSVLYNPLLKEFK